jgi:hypothetical protein
MQSGTDKLKKWKVEFNSKERWENHLMGWGSSGDAMSNTQLEFPSKEDAIIYCQRQGEIFIFVLPAWNKISMRFSDMLNLVQGLD